MRRRIKVYVRYLAIKGHIRKSDSYWSPAHNRWLQYFKFFNVYLYKSRLFNTANKYFISTQRIKEYQVKSYPIIYTIDELKRIYPNYYCIPASPEIKVWINSKLFPMPDKKFTVRSCYV